MAVCQRWKCLLSLTEKFLTDSGCRKKVFKIWTTVEELWTYHDLFGWIISIKLSQTVGFVMDLGYRNHEPSNSSIVFRGDQKWQVNSKPYRYIVNVCPYLLEMVVPWSHISTGKMCKSVSSYIYFKIYKIQPHQLLKLYCQLI